jgi:beta-galactosidase/beta-glucuronidase
MRCLVADPGSSSLMGTITNPKLWTAETPNLYVLVVSLYRDLEGAEKEQGALDVETCRVGIRDVQFAGEGKQLKNLTFYDFNSAAAGPPLHMLNAPFRGKTTKT